MCDLVITDTDRYINSIIAVLDEVIDNLTQIPEVGTRTVTLLRPDNRF